jgi:hypothetical protein
MVSDMVTAFGENNRANIAANQAFNEKLLEASAAREEKLMQHQAQQAQMFSAVVGGYFVNNVEKT